jgi:ribA/ribD-fused uncharacterized protein
MDDIGQEEQLELVDETSDPEDNPLENYQWTLIDECEGDSPTKTTSSQPHTLILAKHQQPHKPKHHSSSHQQQIQPRPSHQSQLPPVSYPLITSSSSAIPLIRATTLYLSQPSMIQQPQQHQPLPRKTPQILTTTEGIRIAPFFSDDFVFSNHFPARFELDGRIYTSVEQYYMFKKALFCGENWTANEVLKMDNPKKMKNICNGKRLRAFRTEDWRKVSREVMTTGVMNKFGQNEKLRRLLMETGDAMLVEAAMWDYYWGVGLSPSDPKIIDRGSWKGSNVLGQILTAVRQQLKEQYSLEWHEAQRPSGSIYNFRPSGETPLRQLFSKTQGYTVAAVLGDF